MSNYLIKKVMLLEKSSLINFFLLNTFKDCFISASMKLLYEIFVIVFHPIKK